MINLRYHIVSITAVFLALGIGVALGSTLIQRGLVDTLNDRLDEQAERLDRTDGENAELRGRLDEIAELDERLTTEGTALYAGHLTDVPVLVVATGGVDESLVDLTRRSLRDAGAQVHGILRFTGRWTDLDEGEVAELAELTEQPVAEADLVRTRVMRDLADEMLVAAELPPDPEPETPTVTDDGVDATPQDGTDQATEDGTDQATEDGTDQAVEDAPVQDPAPETTTTTTPPEPNGLLLAALLERGYLEFLPDEAGTPLPEAAARFVVVQTPESDVPIEAALLPLLEELAAADPAPVVVIEPLPEPVEDPEAELDDDAAPAAGPLVDLVRNDPQMRLSLTTVDMARHFIGQAATVLGLADLAAPDPGVGHYGVAEGAGALLPAAG
ncbi:copper transporter [Actinomarinicola tropica]|uniref:Copper transporter n=1 Tax=Actinomarinicola tropica TaxID=2789776 RepID=A0A5Q2RI55_9ACTN|nr:copper transporter [Actinomarinicola tropica]QGG95224.1 hypothetical protein GH723_09030 [Actinomarinicola tropica]